MVRARGILSVRARARARAWAADAPRRPRRRAARARSTEHTGSLRTANGDRHRGASRRAKDGPH